MTRPRLPSAVLDALLGQPFGSVAWQDALERLEGPHPLGDGPDLQAVLALPVMLRLAPEFGRRQLNLLAVPVQDQGEAALYVTLSQPKGPRHLIGSTERTPAGSALRLFGHPLAQALSVFGPDGPVAALFSPARPPTRLNTRTEVEVDHPGGVLQAANERLQLDWPHLLPAGLHFEVAGHHGRTLTLDVTAQVGHGPEGLSWTETGPAASPGPPGFP